MDKSLEFIEQYVKENDTVVCATSGGSDSMVLINLLLLYRKKVDIKIICAHVNHLLREESNEEYEFVKKFCNNNDVIFEGTKFDDYKKGNIEAQAHKKRYDFFYNIVKKYNAKYLFTAHHGDDLVETILMKLTRGSSLNGYIGFDYILKLKEYTILRPLVFYTKDEIRKYAEDNKIEYREDKTNFSDLYTRNRYRKYVLPFLKKENKDVHLKYLKYNELLKENNDYIDREVEKAYDEVCKDNIIDINKILSMDIFLIKKVIYKFLQENLNSKVGFIESKHIEYIINSIKTNKPNIQIDLPCGLILKKKYNCLSIDSYMKYDDYKLEINGEVKVPYGKIKEVSDTSLTNNYVCYLDSKNIKLPLYVRNKKDGDYIYLLGSGNRKKIKDIFINEKIDVDKRKDYPIVVDSDDNVIWLPGIKKSKYDTIKTGKYDIILWYDKEEENE